MVNRPRAGLHQIHELDAVRVEVVALDGQEPGGKVIVDAPARRAAGLDCISRRCQPLPASSVNRSMALRANRAVGHRKVASIRTVVVWRKSADMTHRATVKKRGASRSRELWHRNLH